MNDVLRIFSLSKLVPDVVFASWLCFRMQKNVWATRRVQESRVITQETHVEKNWFVDSGKRQISLYKSGKMERESIIEDGRTISLRQFENGKLRYDNGKFYFDDRVQNMFRQQIAAELGAELQ